MSEALALKWFDVDWQNGTLLIERGIVRQRVGNVKTPESEQKVSVDPEMLAVMNSWRQTTSFSDESEWPTYLCSVIGRIRYSTGVSGPGTSSSFSQTQPCTNKIA